MSLSPSLLKEELSAMLHCIQIFTNTSEILLQVMRNIRKTLHLYCVIDKLSILMKSEYIVYACLESLYIHLYLIWYDSLFVFLMQWKLYLLLGSRFNVLPALQMFTVHRCQYSLQFNRKGEKFKDRGCIIWRSYIWFEYLWCHSLQKFCKKPGSIFWHVHSKMFAANMQHMCCNITGLNTSLLYHQHLL